MERTASSGLVLRPLIRDITSERLDFVKTSVIQIPVLLYEHRYLSSGILLLKDE